MQQCERYNKIMENFGFIIRTKNKTRSYDFFYFFYYIIRLKILFVYLSKYHPIFKSFNASMILASILSLLVVIS